MSPAQKVIKYFAFAFAVGLIVTILSSIILALSSVSGSSHLFAGDVNYIDFTKEFDDVKNLDISNYSGKMYIQPGDVTKVIVEAKKVPDQLQATLENKQTLVIENENRNFLFSFGWWDSEDAQDTKITITFPRNLSFDTASFDNGSGIMELRGIKSNVFELDGGSGKIIVSEILAGKTNISTASGRSELDGVVLANGDIDTGSGSVKISNSSLTDMDMDFGSGAVSFAGLLKGKNHIDGGSGSISIEVLESIQEYDIQLNKGSGGVYVNGERRDDQDIRNDHAEHQLIIEGGSGRVKVDFTE